jgi:HD-like signal output (HDOD) protein
MKINLLLVDDEPEIINGYRRILHSMKNEWGLFFALSGEEALEILKVEQIDVVITDMRMPSMDGTMLLSKVKKYYPQTLRLILSGHIDEQKAVNATGVAHQFMTKPCNTELIKTTIEKSFSLRNHIKNDNLINIVNGLGELPVLPELYMKIEEELQKKNISFSIINELISQDIGLSVKLLQVVNSSFFGLQMRVTDLTQAINFLGVNFIKSLILHISLFSAKNLSLPSRKFCEQISKHSLDVASIAKKIAIRESKEQKFVEDCFTASIIHDLGKIVLLSITDYLNQVQHIMTKNKIEFNQAEYNLYNTSHSEIGAYLLGIWGLPDEIVKSVCFHHTPLESGMSEFSSLTVVHAANALLHLTIEQIQLINDKNILDSIKFLDVDYIKKLNFENKVYDWFNNFIKISR